MYSITTKKELIKGTSTFHWDNYFFFVTSFDKNETQGWLPHYPSSCYKTKDIHISEVKEVKLLVDSKEVSRFKRGAIGALLFGGIGAIGGLISAIKAKPKSDISILVLVDDIVFSAITIPCKDMSIAAKVLSTLEKMDEDYTKTIIENTRPSDNIEILSSFLKLIRNDKFDQAESQLFDLFKTNHDHYIYLYIKSMFHIWKHENLEKIPSLLDKIDNPISSEEKELLSEIINTKTGFYNEDIQDTLLVEAIHYSNDSQIERIKKILEIGADPNLKATYDFESKTGIVSVSPLSQAKNRKFVRELLIYHGATENAG